MPEISIIIPANFKWEHERVVLKYFEAAGRLRVNEWKLAFEAFDRLAHAKIYWYARQMSFADYYKQFVEATHADQFILTLLESENISTTAERLQAEVSRKILSTLQEEGLYAADVEGSQFLAAYSLYWWNSFARGYSFSIANVLCRWFAIFISHAFGTLNVGYICLPSFSHSKCGSKSMVKYIRHRLRKPCIFSQIPSPLRWRNRSGL